MTVQGKEVKIIKPKTGDKEELLRVGAYCRVSTDSDDQLNSFFAQVQHYNDYIRENDSMRLVEIYADEGITGTSIDKRDEFKRMMRDARNKKLGRILVKSVTRFARNALECIEAVRELKSCGVSVYFENDNIDTARMNSEMILYIKSAFAQGEAMSASKRMQTSVRMKMADGTYVTSSAPFGYRLVDNVLVIEPNEAEIVRDIYRLYLSGRGITVILKYLQSERAPGLNWSENGINYILRNERYIGDSLWQKSFVPNILPLRQQRNKGELPKYYCENTHEAIISKEEFESVRALMKSRSNYHKPPNKHREFLSGKICCRQCGWKYKRRYKAGELRWTCSRKGKDIKDCHAPQLSDNEIREAFVRLFNIIKQNERTLIVETITQLQTLKTKINSGNNAILEIDEELMSLSQKNATYGELFMQGVIDHTLFVQQTDVLNQKIYELRTRRSKLISEDDDEKCIERMRELRKVISSSGYLVSMDERLFDSIIETVYVEQDGTLTFRLKCELEFSIKRR